MIKALLRSEWIKFRSYYLALGAALVVLVVVPFYCEVPRTPLL